MHENIDHLLAEAWWVTLKSHDLFSLISEKLLVAAVAEVDLFLEEKDQS